jgi:hypothetical protein
MMPQKLAESRRLYRVGEAAAFFSMSTRWVRDRIRAGELEAFDLGDWAVSGASMNALLERRRVVATKK